MIAGLDHLQIAIPADGEAAARHFYGSILGFTEIEKPEALKARGGMWFLAGIAEIHLGIDPDFHPARKGHPAFRVGDLATVTDALGVAGIATVSETDLPGQKRIFAEDPFGNRIEFVERTAR